MTRRGGEHHRRRQPTGQLHHVSQTGATYPSVALNAAGVVVEVHQSGNDLAWRRGKLAGTTLTWSPVKNLITNGTRPSVAINNNGIAVVLFERGGKLVRQRRRRS